MDNRKEPGKNLVSIRYTNNVTVQFSNRKCDWNRNYSKTSEQRTHWGQASCPL